VRPDELGKFRKFIHIFRFRTRDPQACSIVSDITGGRFCGQLSDCCPKETVLHWLSYVSVLLCACIMMGACGPVFMELDMMIHYREKIRIFHIAPPYATLTW
jgi:hypothetical protein